MKLVLILSIHFLSLVSWAQDDLKPAPPSSPKDRVVYLEKSADMIKQISEAKTLEAKLAVVSKFKTHLMKVREDAQKAVVKFKGDAKKRVPLEDRELESINWMLAFEHVFDSALTEKFRASTEFRETTCKQVPHDIEFSELASKPDGAELSDYGKLATEMMEKICSP